ncbi:MAG: RIP metalloprotease RseP [Thermonemataceae bacterium]|nr:RIP metalloprotease RseP [Thermonemataceae bacterium]
MDKLVMIGQLLLGLSILVGLHEWGHYIAARTFKIRVEKFYIFFDFLFPMPNLLNFALWKKKKGDTEFGLGWFPLGGYVKIAGMMDESMDKEALAKPAEPWEFRSKPAWQRLIVMMGGIIVNLILGVVIFIAITFINGDKYIPAEEAAKYGIVAKEMGKKIGLRSGDKIININGEKYERFNDIISPNVLLSSDAYYTIERDGKQMQIKLPNDLLEKMTDFKKNETFISFLPRNKSLFIKQVQPKSMAEKAKLQEGDKITAVNGKEVIFFDEFQEILAANKLKTVEITVLRKSGEAKLKVNVTDAGTIGVLMDFSNIKYKEEQYSLGQSAMIGTQRAFGVIFDNVRAFGKIFKGEVSFTKSVGGPVKIAEMYGSLWDWTKFWTLTGMLSMVLAFMNFLPIPALDGGHVIFLLYEMLRGKPAPEKVIEVAQQIGMILLLGLMGFVLFADIFLK